MARVKATIKINQLRGPRLKDTHQIETKDNEYARVTADGVAVADTAGTLYWIEAIVTSDGGGMVAYDNGAASGQRLAGAYAAKAVDSVIKNYDPPKPFNHGVYVDLTNADVIVCYRPHGRNLKCQVTVPPIKFLYSRVTVRRVEKGTSLPTRAHGKLVARVEVEREHVGLYVTKSLVSRVTVFKRTNKALVARTTVYKRGTSSLKVRCLVTD